MLMLFLKLSGSSSRHPLSTGAKQRGLSWPKCGTISAFWVSGHGLVHLAGWPSVHLTHPQDLCFAEECALGSLH